MSPLQYLCCKNILYVYNSQSQLAVLQVIIEEQKVLPHIFCITICVTFLYMSQEDECVTWKLLHSWSISLGCSWHRRSFHFHLLGTADTETQGPLLHLLRGYSSHWRNLPHLTTKTNASLQPAVCTIHVHPCICMFPTLWYVAAHHRHVALVYEVS